MDAGIPASKTRVLKRQEGVQFLEGALSKEISDVDR